MSLKLDYNFVGHEYRFERAGLFFIRPKAVDKGHILSLFEEATRKESHDDI